MNPSRANGGFYTINTDIGNRQQVLGCGPGVVGMTNRVVEVFKDTRWKDEVCIFENKNYDLFDVQGKQGKDSLGDEEVSSVGEKWGVGDDTDGFFLQFH